MENLNQLEFATTKKKLYGKSTKLSKQAKITPAQKPGKVSKKSKTCKKVQKALQAVAGKPKHLKLFTKPREASLANKPLNLRHSILVKADPKHTTKTQIHISFDQRNKSLKPEQAKPKLIFKSRVGEKLLKNIEKNKRVTPNLLPSETLKTPEALYTKKLRQLSDFSQKKAKPRSDFQRFSDRGVMRTLETTNDEIFNVNFNNCTFSTPKKFNSDSSFVVNKLDYSEVVVCDDKKMRTPPKGMVKAYSSPEKKFTVKSPDGWPGDKAPRKTLYGFESPDSFHFSVSSSSFEYNAYEEQELNP